jgi:hypothetical protein
MENEEKQRPELLTDQFITDLCDWIADGKSVRSYCRENPEYKPSTIVLWADTFPDFAEQYTRANLLRADSKFDKIDDVIEDMRKQTIDPQMARVEIDAIKWQSGKLQPKKYGEKIDVTTGGEKVQSFTFNIRELDVSGSEKQEN